MDWIFFSHFIFLALGLAAFTYGAVLCLRHIRLKRRGIKTKALLTNIQSKRWSLKEYHVTVIWRDPEGQQRSADILSSYYRLARHCGQTVEAYIRWGNERVILEAEPLPNAAGLLTFFGFIWVVRSLIRIFMYL